MNDQAQKLRELFSDRSHPDRSRQISDSTLKTIAITSGKGGVGKTNICLNLGIALANMGKKVLVLDADLNLGNLDVLLGLNPQYTLRNVISGEKTMDQILINGPGGIKLLPAGSGALELFDIPPEMRKKIAQNFQRFDFQYDFLLIDTPAGLGHHVFDFLDIADSILVITTPEPTAIIDAYAMIKILHSRNQMRNIELVINFVRSEDEAEQVVTKLNIVIDKFLHSKIQKWNYVLSDNNVSKAVLNQEPFFTADQGGKASACIQKIAIQVSSVNDASFKKTEPLYSKLFRKSKTHIGTTVDATID